MKEDVEAASTPGGERHDTATERYCQGRDRLDEPVLRQAHGLPAKRTGPRLATDDLASVFPVGLASCRLAVSGRAVHRPQAKRLRARIISSAKSFTERAVSIARPVNETGREGPPLAQELILHLDHAAKWCVRLSTGSNHPERRHAVVMGPARFSIGESDDPGNRLVAIVGVDPLR